MTIPIISLKEIRYAEKSYKPAGVPCVMFGKFLMATVLGASVAGQPDYTFSGLSAGLAFYLTGKGLNFFGAKFGRDVIYYDTALPTTSIMALIDVLPLAYHLDTDGDLVSNNHDAFPFEPTEWHYVSTRQIAEQNFDYFEQAICFLGHSHLPGIFEKSAFWR